MNLYTIARLRLKTPVGKASRSRDERSRGPWATSERGADRATQPTGVFKRSLVAPGRSNMCASD